MWTRVGVLCTPQKTILSPRKARSRPTAGAHAREARENPQRRASALRSARPPDVRIQGGPVALATVPSSGQSPSRPSSQGTSGREALAMASSTRASFSAADGLAETEKNSGETENTYILRPIFQQRRVADGFVPGRLGRCWIWQAELT